MVALVAVGRSGVELAAELLPLLVDSAERDPLLEATGRGSTHCDGFGYYAVVGLEGSLVRLYERFDAADTVRDPVKACRANVELARRRLAELAALLRRASEAYLVVHARLSGGRPRGTWYAQPIVHPVAGRESRAFTVVAHNGRFDAERIASSLGLRATRYSDTELFTVWLAARLSQGVGLVEALLEGYGFAATGYNLAVLLDGVESRRLVCSSAVSPTVTGEAQLRYYTHYVARGDGLTAFVSSTIRLYAEEKGLPLSYENAFGAIVELSPGEARAAARLAPPSGKQGGGKG